MVIVELPPLDVELPIMRLTDVQLMRGLDAWDTEYVIPNGRCLDAVPNPYQTPMNR